MNVKLSLDAILLALVMGGFLSLIYLGLLWYSLKLLPKIKNRGLFLFISAGLRIFLFLFMAIWLAQNHAGRFLWIVIGFVSVRLILVSRIKNRRKK